MDTQQKWWHCLLWGLILGPPVIALCALYRGWATATLWNWFAAGHYSLPGIHVAHAAGLWLVYASVFELKFRKPPPLNASVGEVILLLILVLAGWLARCWFGA